MIDLDYGPLAVGLMVAYSFIMPFIYSFFLDHEKK